MSLINIPKDASGTEEQTKTQAWRASKSADLQSRKAAGHSAFTIALAKVDEQAVSSPALAFEHTISTGSNIAFSDRIKEQLQQMKTPRYLVSNAQVSYPGGLQNIPVDPHKTMA